MLEEAGLTLEVLERARRSRDARFDGKFFIAVTSTRIYCRPICPAKTSKDCNVRYYLTAAEAAAAGFRPCLRCRPESAPGSPAWLGTSAVVRRGLRMIQSGALDEGSVEQLAGRLGVGARHLCRLFTQHLGTSPSAIGQTRRLNFAKQLLDETELPITQVALASGFRSVRRFNDAFKAMYRRSPRDLRMRLRADRNGSPDAQIKLQLSYRPPYDWSRLLGFLERTAIAGVESVAGGVYRRTVSTRKGHAIVQIRPAPGGAALELYIRGGEPADLLSLSSSARRMFDLSADPARIAAVLGRDPRLSGYVSTRPGLRIPGTWDPFESGVRAIVSESMDTVEAQSILSRLVESAGRAVSSDDNRLNRLFPTASALVEAKLETLGISPVRAEALRSFALAVLDKSITFDEADTHLVRAFAKLSGVSAWAAGYVALRGLGEPDGYPRGDPILRRRASSRQLAAQELDAHAERWRPFRGYAVMHFWEAENAEAAEESLDVRTQPVSTLPSR